MTEYGTVDLDDSAYKVLMHSVEGLDIEYVIHHPRKPINARPCQLPGLLRVQAVTRNGQVITAEQYKVGGTVRIFGISKGN